MSWANSSTNATRPKEAVAQYLDLIDGIARDKLNANVSVKLTAMGLDIDPEFTRTNVRKIMQAANDKGMFVRIDMEDSPRTDKTIEIYRDFRKEFNCGLVVQAYLRRTADDVAKLMAEGKSNFRLCKGIYVEPEAIAFKGRDEIRANFLRAARADVPGRRLRRHRHPRRRPHRRAPSS